MGFFFVNKNKYNLYYFYTFRIIFKLKNRKKLINLENHEKKDKLTHIHAFTLP